MKKSILKLLRENESEADGESFGIKELKKAVCAQYTEIEDKKDRKIKFQESLSKLEARGKVFVDNCVVKLIGKRQILHDSDADSPNAKKHKVSPSQSLVEKSPSKERYDEESRKQKNSNHEKLVKEIPTIPAVSVVALLPQVDAELEKKIYPPVEAQTGNNTILLFYAYCVPVMSRSESPKCVMFFISQCW